MKEVKRVVSTSFWTDTMVEEFSVEDRYFMLYLLTNPQTSQLGIYEISVKKMSNETGYSQDVIRVLLDRFEKQYDMIRYSKKTKEIAIKNFLRHSIVKGGKPVMDCLLKDEKDVKDKELMIFVLEHLNGYKDSLNETVVDFVERMSRIYILNDNDNDNENDNDNDNERIVPRIVDESYHESLLAKYPFEMKIVEMLIKNDLELFPNSKVPVADKEKEVWAKHVERMKRLDRLSEEEILEATQFAINDSFWSSNIRSTKKLREKFETLIIQARKKGFKPNGNTQRTDGAYIDGYWYTQEEIDQLEDAKRRFGQ